MLFGKLFDECVEVVIACLHGRLGYTYHGSGARLSRVLGCRLKQHPRRFVLGLLLFAITFMINLTADLVVRGIRKEG